MITKCKNCGKELVMHSKGMCITCYKKLEWKPKLVKCKRCGRDRPMHAKGYCAGCYNFMFHLDKNRNEGYKKYHNIEPDLYKKLTKECIICGFKEVVELHHLDENTQNNSESNFLALCPNHHRMIHHTNFKQEVLDLLKEKGISQNKCD
jgi:hypothetical protein